MGFTAKPTVLVTGFGPFPPHCDPNPSSAALQNAVSQGFLRSAAVNVIAVAIPTAWGDAYTTFETLIDRYAPAAVLSCGVHNKLGPQFAWELCGANRQNQDFPDARGTVATAATILPDGPASIDLAPPSHAVVAAIACHGATLVTSQNAGDYLSNYLAYLGGLLCARLHIPFGFLHVPLVRESHPALQQEIQDVYAEAGHQLTWQQITHSTHTLTMDALAQVMADVIAAFTLATASHRGRSLT